jgi:hypothetical protein
LSFSIGLIGDELDERGREEVVLKFLEAENK